MTSEPISLSAAETVAARPASYVFDNAVHELARRRLEALDDLYTARSIALMASCGLKKGWRCLEIGCGSGALAFKMAERVGPSGAVYVTDIDTTHVDRIALARHPQVVLLTHDVTCDCLPEDSFDLIHARLVLSHLPARQQVLDTLITHLTPGGWLMIEEFDPTAIDRTAVVGDGETAKIFRDVFGALGKVMAGHGYDPGFARSLPERFVQAGLVDIAVDAYTSVRESGSQRRSWILRTCCRCAPSCFQPACFRDLRSNPPSGVCGRRAHGSSVP